VAETLGRALPGVPVFASHLVSPEFREYERLTTTVINAVVSPVLERYLGAFEDVLARRGFAGGLFVMTSNGGTISRGMAGRMGALTILSGPVGGVRGAITAAQALGRDRIITLDMGGTSTDVSLVEGAAPQLARETVLNGFPIRLPQLNIIAVGTGGGSIAYFDEGGALHVGPRSAGAAPGPVCYGQGGTEPTVTDANLLLGRLEDSLLGGQMRLDRALGDAALERMAQANRMSAIRLAEGIVTISVAHMGNAIREVSIKQGHDPREFTLVAFGGAGPMHACFLAEELGMREVIVPLHPGNVSAYGLLASDLRQDSVRTWIRAWPAVTSAALRAALTAQAERLGAEAAAAGWPLADAVVGYAADVRYQGQAFEVTVGLPDLDDASLATLPELFEARHVELYGHAHDRDVEVVNLRTAIRRYALAPGETMTGPAILTEDGATTVLPQGWALSVARNGALLLTRFEERRPIPPLSEA
jgi:N-methylhydantoinase A